jgi:hypothetical protein
VLAHSLLAAGPMQECHPSPLQCRIHEPPATSRARIGPGLAPAQGLRQAEAAVPIS